MQKNHIDQVHYKIIYNFVSDFFDGDTKKTAMWFRANNPALGNISPRDMIRFGQIDKLHEFITAAINGNTP